MLLEGEAAADAHRDGDLPLTGDSCYGFFELPY